jgi:hypothetical protein
VLIEMRDAGISDRAAILNAIADLQAIGCKARDLLAVYHDANDSVVAVVDDCGAAIVVCMRDNGSRRRIRDNQESNKK